MGLPRDILLSFCLFFTVYDEKIFFYKNYWWLDSNPGSLVSEATALPTNYATAPYILPILKVFTDQIIILSLSSRLGGVHHLIILLLKL